MEEKKYKVPRGKSATAAKNKFRDKNYDRTELALPKGMKSLIDAAVIRGGYASRNTYIIEAVKEKYEKETGIKMELEKEEKTVD